MPAVQTLRELVKRRLTAAGEEVLQLFERRTAELQEETARLKQENQRQRRQLEAVWLHRAGLCVSHYECRIDAVFITAAGKDI